MHNLTIGWVYLLRKYVTTRLHVIFKLYLSHDAVTACVKRKTFNSTIDNNSTFLFTFGYVISVQTLVSLPIYMTHDLIEYAIVRWSVCSSLSYFFFLKHYDDKPILHHKKRPQTSIHFIQLIDCITSRLNVDFFCLIHSNGITKDNLTIKKLANLNFVCV